MWLLGAPAGCGGDSAVGVRKVPIGAQGAGTPAPNTLFVGTIAQRSSRIFGTFRIRDIETEDGSFDGVTGNRSSVPGTEEKRTIVLNAKGTFGAKGLTGTWKVREIQTDPSGNMTDDCDTSDLGYAAVRGAR